LSGAAVECTITSQYLEKNMTERKQKKPSSKSRVNRRRDRAAERLEVTGTLTPKERLERLDQRLGVGKGAKKERAKILSLMTGTKK
jgi:hypothetical protein